MTFRGEKLYDLLPEVYRVRDAEGRESAALDDDLPLRSLLSVIAREVAVVEEDLAQLYDDLFVETCAEWVVPYVGDLVGVGGLHELQDAASRRAQVANTVAYRRRKGTAAILEGVARDATGWPAHAVEFFRVLAATQHLNHVRPSNLRSPDLRRWKPLEHAGTPFDEIAHTADMRRIASGSGSRRHNIPNVGIFLWRLGARPLTHSPAVRADSQDDRRYRFDPLNRDTPLFTKPEPEPDIAHISTPTNVPAPIGRRVLREALEKDPGAYYGAGKSLSLVGVYRKTGSEDFRVEEYGPGVVQACDLSDAEGGGWAHEHENRISVDPVLGRVFFSVDPPDGHELARLLVTYHYGFAADVGGGEYDRAASIRTGPQPAALVEMPETRAALEALADGASEDETPEGLEPSPTIQEALSALGGQGGVVEVLDGGRYDETPSIDARSDRRVEVRAADGHRPTLVLSGDLEIEGGDEADVESEVTLSGLLITGGALRVSGHLRRLRLLDCTLVPGIGLEPDGEPAEGTEPSLIVEGGAGEVEVVEVDRCVLGGLRVPEGTEVRVAESIIDATDSTSVAFAAPDGEGAGGRLNVKSSTIIGKVHAGSIELASNTIFLSDLAQDDDWEAPVVCEKLQEGCVRFSYLPLDARAPRRHRCRPESEAEAGRVLPQFTSLRYGDPGYCQLGRLCAEEIARGADDESEMGVFYHLHAPQREANLRARLEEYLRFGLEAGILYAT